MPRELKRAGVGAHRLDGEAGGALAERSQQSRVVLERGHP